jgi:hypothetical protein
MSVHISSWCVHSVHTSVLEVYTQWMHQFLLGMLSMYWRDLFKFEIFTPMLSKCVRNWCISGTHQFLTYMISERISSLCKRSGYASVPDSYAQHVFKGPFQISYMRSVRAWVPDTYAQSTHLFLTCMLSAYINSWGIYSVHTSVPYAYAEDIQNDHLKNGKTDAHAEHACKELMGMIIVLIGSWHVCSAGASVLDMYSQRVHKSGSMLVRKSIFLVIFKVPKTEKI